MSGEECGGWFATEGAARDQGNVYKIVVKPAVMYGWEMLALTKREEAELEVAELRKLRFSLGKTRTGLEMKTTDRQLGFYILETKLEKQVWAVWNIWRGGIADILDRAARQVGKRKTSEEVRRCCEGGVQSDRRMVEGRCRQVISCSDNVVSSENGNVKRKAK